MKKRSKIIIAVAMVVVVAVGGGIALNIWRHSLGEVKVPEAVQLNSSTYRFTDGLNVTQQYLIIGSERALLIDTGNGLNDLPRAIARLTDVPVSVVNTHGHYDHTHGNHYFPEVYLSAADADVYREYNDPATIAGVLSQTPAIVQWLTKYADEATQSVPTTDDFVPLPEEGYFDLGDRRIEIMHIAGHTPGSIALIDERERALYAGDMVAGGVLMNLPESVSLVTFRDSIRALEARASQGDFEEIFGGHGDPSDASALETYDQLATDVIDGNISEGDLRTGSHSADGITLNFAPSKIH